MSERWLASYYERHLALVDGVAQGWVGRGGPKPMRPGVVQVGVGKDAYFALQVDGTLITWTDAEIARPRRLMRDVAAFASGATGWFAIDRQAVLWHGLGEVSAPSSAAPRPVAEDVVAACIGDGADYFVSRDGRLHVKGLAHRGQYGDGRLRATDDFVVTADQVAAVRAHTGHAILLRRDGVVMGTGGNRFGPLGAHGLGDKADRWGRIFDGAVQIATGSRHSAAIRGDGSLWAWGEGFGIVPVRLIDQAVSVAAGDTATLARTADGALWQWDGGGVPRRLAPG